MEEAELFTLPIKMGGSAIINSSGNVNSFKISRQSCSIPIPSIINKDEFNLQQH